MLFPPIFHLHIQNSHERVTRARDCVQVIPVHSALEVISTAKRELIAAALSSTPVHNSFISVPFELRQCTTYSLSLSTSERGASLNHPNEENSSNKSDTLILHGLLALGMNNRSIDSLHSYWRNSVKFITFMSLHFHYWLSRSGSSRLVFKSADAIESRAAASARVSNGIEKTEPMPVESARICADR